jgi:7-carboxy-7-deazaguanine synthase
MKEPLASKPLPVNELFYTFQGEGVFMGCAAFFVRLNGCDQRCGWCDSASTWHPKYKPEGVLRLTPLQILQHLQEAKVQAGAFVVVTGGEPALHPLYPLISLCRAHGYNVHIETAGHRPLPRSIDWITLSPKPFSIKPLPENVLRANEFKIIVDSEAALEEGLDCVLPYARDKAAIWLHPEWGHRSDPDILGLITERVKANPRLRAGYQIHKLYRSDALDPNSRKEIIPLGGDPQRGSSQ